VVELAVEPHHASDQHGDGEPEQCHRKRHGESRAFRHVFSLPFLSFATAWCVVTATYSP
jgi:hypothetical protein